jgi:oxygen-independent coproporphyrinogen-3 oxidase
VEKTGSGETKRTAMSARERDEEFLMMGLRLREGVDTAGMSAPPPPDRIAAMEELGMLEREGTCLRLTRAGRPLLNAVLRELLV